MAFLKTHRVCPVGGKIGRPSNWDPGWWPGHPTLHPCISNQQNLYADDSSQLCELGPRNKSFPNRRSDTSTEFTFQTNASTQHFSERSCHWRCVNNIIVPVQVQVNLLQTCNLASVVPSHQDFNHLDCSSASLLVAVKPPRRQRHFWSINADSRGVTQWNWNVQGKDLPSLKPTDLAPWQGASLRWRLSS